MGPKLKAWAIVEKSKIITVNTLYTLELYKTKAQARTALFYIKRDCITKYDAKIVPVEIEIKKKR